MDEQARFDVTPLWPATDGPGLLALELLDRGLAADVVYAATGLDPLSQSYAANERRRWLMRHVARAHDVPARLLWVKAWRPCSRFMVDCTGAARMTTLIPLAVSSTSVRS